MSGDEGAGFGGVIFVVPAGFQGAGATARAVEGRVGGGTGELVQIHVRRFEVVQGEAEGGPIQVFGGGVGGVGGCAAAKWQS